MLRSVARRLRLILFGGILLSILGYLGMQPLTRLLAQPARPSDPTPMEAVALDSRLVDANTRFGFKLFAQVFQRGDKNVLISPASVAIVLGMTHNGASGQTQHAMQQTLAFEGMSLEQVNQANQALLSQIQNADAEVTLTIANSLWAMAGLTFQPDFVQHNQTFYAADITQLDFSHPDAADRINAWVNNKTAGKIPEIVGQINPNDILFLINAIYFKGNWTTPFNPSNTIDRPFHLADGSVKSHPFMSQPGRYSYLETDQFQAIQLPYGKKRWQMLLFLPKPNSDLTRFAQSLTSENWQTWMHRFMVSPGIIQLPRFRLEYGLSLVDALKALGMSIAFDPDHADFAAMTDRPAYISEVQHKTFMEVNEAGTEAAAATSVTVTTRAALPQPPFQMTVDRPFFYAIQDETTGTILFTGAIGEPEG